MCQLDTIRTSARNRACHVHIEQATSAGCVLYGALSAATKGRKIIDEARLYLARVKQTNAEIDKVVTLSRAASDACNAVLAETDSIEKTALVTTAVDTFSSFVAQVKGAQVSGIAKFLPSSTHECYNVPIGLVLQIVEKLWSAAVGPLSSETKLDAETLQTLVDNKAVFVEMAGKIQDLVADAAAHDVVEKRWTAVLADHKKNSEVFSWCASAANAAREKYSDPGLRAPAYWHV